MFKELLNGIQIFILLFIGIGWYLEYGDNTNWRTVFAKLFLILSFVLSFIFLTLFLYHNIASDINYSIISFGLSNSFDYNYFSVLILISLTILLFRININISFFYKIIIANLFIIVILLSRSRRGLFLLLLVLIIFILWAFYQKIIINRAVKSDVFLSFWFLFCGLLIMMFLSISKPNFRNKIVDNQKTKIEITSLFYRYLSTFTNPNQSYDELYLNLWVGEIISEDPDSGWGTRIHETVKVDGNVKNALGVPQESKGLLIDKRTVANEWGGNAYAYTYLGEYSIEIGDKIEASVFCYFSKDFNGTVRLTMQRELKPNISVFAEKEKNEEWQKLNLSFNENGKVKIYLYVILPNYKNFSKLSGDVVFLYPICRVFKNDILIEEGLHALNKSKHELGFFYNRTMEQAAHYKRIDRWRYAFSIWNKEYNFAEKCFGNGFSYLNRFGEKYFDNRNRLDYPHNVIVSSFLYSGIFGGIIYLSFLFFVFLNYIKRMKNSKLFFLMFLFLFYFVMFSGNSHFSIPAFAFLSFLPFLKI